MAVNTLTMRNALVTAYIAAAIQAALYTTTVAAGPSGAMGTEVAVSGYARQTLSWSAASASATTATATFTIGAACTIAGAGVHATSGGAYLDGGNVTSQVFATAGTYTLTLTYTQS